MNWRQALIAEFEQEMANTRRVLERVPMDRLEFRPHARSYTMGKLALHVATLPSWIHHTFATTELDIQPGGSAPPAPPLPATSEELLRTFDDGVAQARATLERLEESDLGVPWSLLANGKTIFTLPRAAVLRGFCLSHLIHHRAQLGVYLRLNDVPVPGMYGPSADDASF